MKELTITGRDAGQRLDKYLAKVLSEAPKSFLYRMMRKKNITLNGKKADGSEKLAEADIVRLWFSDDTYEKFAGAAAAVKQEEHFPVRPLHIIYEDENILLINKPAGMLSQKARETDNSLCEYLIGYLLESGQITREELSHFRPSVCNRLDRNTSGIVAAGKTMAGLQELSRMFRDRSMHKFYRCIVRGEMNDAQRIEGWLRKDEKTNTVTISQDETEGASRIETAYQPVSSGKGLSELEVELITGKTHQIRAHLTSIGHPIVGDPKYGSAKVNARMKDSAGIHRQLLHAYRLEMPELTGPLANLSGKVFIADVPDDFRVVRKIMQ